MKGKQTFVVYHRIGNTVTPHVAHLAGEGSERRVMIGRPIPWSELYSGHTQWIADQIDRVRDAIKKERDRRAARKAAPLCAKQPSGETVVA